MIYIKQFGIILGVTLIAEAIKAVLPLPVPAGVYGLLLMLFALATGIIKLEWVENTALFLVGLFQLMFIPPAVGLIVSYYGFIDIMPQSLTAVIVSSILVIIVTGVAVQGAQRLVNAISQKRR